MIMLRCTSPLINIMIWVIWLIQNSNNLSGNWAFPPISLSPQYYQMGCQHSFCSTHTLKLGEKEGEKKGGRGVNIDHRCSIKRQVQGTYKQIWDLPQSGRILISDKMIKSSLRWCYMVTFNYLSGFKVKLSSEINMN